MVYATLQTQEKPVYDSVAFPPALVGSSRKYLLVQNQLLVQQEKFIKETMCVQKDW